ncbi:hypothetical protein ACE1TI_00145 [Alteribacillus sp. JSM 102045]|uniref:hypothetical protein n=1 Tax=Alteribacillus sp. JSM 102045 TaxID=1562101 RepID=UPI0035C0FB3F
MKIRIFQALVTCLIVTITIYSFVPAAYAAKPKISADTVEGMSIEEIKKGINTNRFTCEELVSAYIDRIESYDQKGPELNAVINIKNKSASALFSLDR